MNNISNNLSIAAKLLNSKTIENAILKAFGEWATEDINKVHWKEQFTEIKWDYKAKKETTRRENPSAPVRDAGDPRDIYDFGNLYESGKESFSLIITSTIAEASWHWNAKNRSGREYAMYVHEGTGTNTTARRFTDDISIPSSFFLKKPGMALKSRITDAMARL